MDAVMQWLGQINLTAVIAASVSFLVGLAVIKPKLTKALSIIGDLADLLSVLKGSLEDGKLSKEEVESIIKEGEELIANFKK